MVHENQLSVDRAVFPSMVATGVRIRAAHGRIEVIDSVAGADPGRQAGVLLPGMIDLQVNGAGGRDCAEGTPAALDTVAGTVWEGGAVAFLPTLITAPWDVLLERLRAVGNWIRHWNGRGAEPLGIHLEGPFLESTGVHDPRCFALPTQARLDQALEAAQGTLRLVTLAPAVPGAVDAVRRLRAAGVTVALGHAESTDHMAACVDAGATLVTHLFNAMGPMHHRKPGVAGHALDEARLSCPLILDGEHVHPVMVRNAWRILGPGRFVMVTDAMAAAGMPDGRYHLGHHHFESRNGIVRDEQGRLAGSALTMATATAKLREFVPDMGDWSLAQVASANPARLLGADGYGAIAVGRRAAFSLLQPDGTVRAIRLG